MKITLFKKFIAGFQVIALASLLLPLWNITNAADPTIVYDTSHFQCVDDDNDDPSDNQTHCAADERIYLNTPQLLNIAVDFPEATNRTKVEIKVPKRLQMDKPSFSTNGAASVVQKYETQSTGDTPDDVETHTFYIKNWTLGNYNISTKVKFNFRYGYEGQVENVTTLVNTNGNEVASEDIGLKSYVDNKIWFRGTPWPSADKYANDAIVQYNLELNIQEKQKGGSYQSTHANHTKAAPMYYDAEVRIKLPPKATFVSWNYTYDTNTHEIVVNKSYLGIWRNVLNFHLKFSNMAIWEQIQWPANALTVTGKEGGKIEKTFTYNLPWENAYIEAPELILDERSRVMRSMIKWEEDQPIIQTVLFNKGSRNANNVAIQYDFPDGVQVNRLSFGESFIAPQEYSLEYTTQNGNTRTVDLPQNLNHFYTRSELQLQSGEYMKSVTLKIEEFLTVNEIRYSYWGANHSNIGIQFFGNVTTHPDETAPVHITVSEDGTQYSERDVNLSYSDTQDFNFEMFHTSNRTTINPGWKIKVVWDIWNRNYYYNNGTYTKDPTIFVFVPENFHPLDATLEVENINNTPNLEFVKNTSGFDIYKIQTQKEWYTEDALSPTGNNNEDIRVSLVLESDIKSEEWDYDFKKLFTLGTTDTNFNYKDTAWADEIDDTWGLGTANGKLTINDDFFHRSTNSIHINRSTFALQDRIQSPQDSIPVSNFDPEEDNFSLNYSSDEWDLTVALYNPKDEAINDFTYNITLPHVGDSNGPQIIEEGQDPWEEVDPSYESSQYPVILTGWVDVSSVPGATVSYSVDGVTFESNPTDFTSIKYIRVNIPNIPSKKEYNLALKYRVPNIDNIPDYNKTAWIKTSYNIWANSYAVGSKKLVLMDTIPTCTTEPNPASNGTPVTTTCIGVKPDTTLTIDNMNCTPSTTWADGIVVCTGTVWTGTGDVSVPDDIVHITDTGGNTNTGVTTGLQIDNEGPTITLIWDNPFIVPLGNPFVDPGATCTDNIDGTCTVSVSWSIDTSIDWNVQIFTYTATDSAGNTASVTRTVKVQAPVVGPGGNSNPTGPQEPGGWTVIKKVWDTTTLINAVNTNKDKDAKKKILEWQCSALIENIEDLKTRALYKKFFISNTSDAYVNQHITFGQFTKVLKKYESLLKDTSADEQNITSILSHIRKALKSKVEREVAIKIFVEYLNKKYTVSPALKAKRNQQSFADVDPNSSYAPYIQEAYNLCLVHGRKTRNGNPINPNEPRVFEPTSYITIAETIKVLVNMWNSWEGIKW